MKIKKNKFLYGLGILVGTSLPIVIDTIAANHGRHYPFIWYLLFIPAILIMSIHPAWKVVVITGVTSMLFAMTFESSHKDYVEHPIDEIACKLNVIVSWMIHLTIGHLLIKNQKLLQKVEEMTVTDSLTGLYNRRYFDLYMEKAIPLNKRLKQPLLLMLIDIDHFKKINDTYGHIFGDYALRHVAEMMKSHIREEDTLIRMGGEEFSILMRRTNIEEARMVAERLRKKVEESPLVYNREKIHMTISLGLSKVESVEKDKMIEKADKALYLAKENGRNQLVILQDDARYDLETNEYKLSAY